jgi:pimeloyl-ACP methyl ester carboxylesterase
MRRSIAAAVAAALLLTACHDPKPKPEASPSPSVSVSSTTPATSTSPSAGLDAVIQRFAKPLGWTGCGDGFECAKLTVPLDYARPASGTIDVGVIRLKASKQSKRIGSLLLNPGGPGGSGVEFARQARSLLPQEIRDRFDVVSFDPRGVGETAPIDCVDDAELDHLLAIDPSPDSPAEEKELFDASRDEALACQRKSGRLLPHVGTVDTAKDMDVLRAALGDDKLTYVGFSYGTMLGARYAEQFPTHIRALVLDGALDPRLTSSQVSGAQAVGFENALTAFLADCTRIGCAFSKHGRSAGEAFDQLMASVDRSPLNATGDTRKVGPSEALFGVAAALYSREYGWPVLRAALESAYTQRDGATLLSLFDNLVERDQHGHFSNSVESQAAISCVDGSYARDQASYDRDAVDFAKKAPRFGRAIAYGTAACAFWPVPPVTREGPVSAPGAPPILVVGTTRDPATPYAWAQGLASQLPGRLLTYEGDGHTAYGFGRSRCVDDQVDAYLLSLTLPKAGMTCR